MYTSISNLPMRLFLEITETGKLSLLGDGTDDELTESWSNIIEEFKKIDPDDAFYRNLMKRRHLDYTVCKYNTVRLGVQVLKFKKDDNIINILKSYGYRINDDTYFDDLQTIERNSISIKDKIDELNKELNNKGDSDLFDFDKTIIKYNVFLGFNLADANTVTVLQFYAIKDEVNNKIKEIKQSNRKKK